MVSKKYKIYNSTNNRLIELNNIVNYDYTNTIKCDIKTIVILVDKYNLSRKGKQHTLIYILKSVIEKLSSKNILTSEIKKTCLDIENNILDDKLEESVLTLELICEGKKAIFKIIFMNVKNILLDILSKYNKKQTINVKQTLTEKVEFRIIKNSYEFFEYYRELGSHIYNAMKKNNIYNCNIINYCSHDIYNYLDKKNVFKNNKHLNSHYYSNPEILLLEGFCLSKYELNELKLSDNKSENDITTRRFGDNVYKKLKGGTKKNKTKNKNGTIQTSKKTLKKITKNNIKHVTNPTIKNTKTNKSTSNTQTKIVNSDNNYYLNFVNLDKLYNKNVKQEMDNIMIKCKSIYFARDIINIPANKATSTSIINTVIHFIARNKLPIKYTILEPEVLLKKGLNLLHSVGKGSIPERQSRLLILEYLPHSKKTQYTKYTKTNDGILLIGKGITMDTGGYNLKPGESIPEMKSDLAGACSVIASIMACARMNIKQNIVAMLPLAENAIGNTSTVSGDVIKAYNGLNVEIIDTDAEGRLVMADTLSYGIEKYPNYNIIELSTLTGEVEDLSCKKFNMGIGINWSNNELQTIVNHGEMNGERLVLVPFISGFDDELKSEIADIRNVCRDCNGQLYPSTTFLSYFINDNSKYLHIDISGSAFKDDKKYAYNDYEASGTGIKLLVDYIKNI